jgi:FkbM family methyltransferase
MRYLNKLKFYLKNLLIYTNTYYLIRYNNLVIQIIYFLNKRMLTEKNNEISFLKKIIPTNALIFDIGANQGYKTEYFLHINPKKILSIEPDKTCVRILKNRYFFNNKVKILDCAISDINGIEKFYVHDKLSGYNTMSSKWYESLSNQNINRWNKNFDFKDEMLVKTLTLDHIISQYFMPDFIKIDVEGYEFNVIKGLSKRIKSINFEANLPEFLDETKKIIFHLENIYESYKFNICVDFKLLFDNSISAKEMIIFLQNTNERYLDIYAFS